MNKLKIFGGGVAGLGLAGVLGYGYMYGNGAVHVVAPASAAVTVAVDGDPFGTVSPGAHGRFNLPQGEHEVTLTPEGAQATVHAVNVDSGMYEEVLPLTGQCLVVFDVTNYWYEENHLLHKLAEEVTVELRSTDGAPFDQPAGVYYSIDEFPMTIEDHATVELLVELECEGLAATDEALILQVFGDTAD